MTPLNTTPTNKIATTAVATSRMAEAAEAEVDTNVEVAEVVAVVEVEVGMEAVVARGITPGIPQGTTLTWTPQLSKTW